MGNLESVLNDFYSCFGIPIVFYDDKWNLNLIKGNCDKSRDLLINFNILKSCKNDKSRYLEISNDNIHLFKFDLLIDEYVNGYFIIGPFKSSKTFGLEEIIFKPYTCITYIKNLLNSLIKDRFTYKDTFSTYVSKSIKYIHTNYYKDICMDDVCNELGLNKSYFCSLFKAYLL